MANTPDQEAETRHAALFADLLAVVNARSGGLGNQCVEITDVGEVWLHTTYHTVEGVYRISQSVRLRTGAALL